WTVYRREGNSSAEWRGVITPGTVSRAVLPLANRMVALRQFQFLLPGGPGLFQFRGAGLAIGERVQELGHLSGVLAVDQVDDHGADGVLDQLAVEDVDQPVDGEHPLPRRARLRERFGVAL